MKKPKRRKNDPVRTREGEPPTQAADFADKLLSGGCMVCGRQLISMVGVFFPSAEFAEKLGVDPKKAIIYVACPDHAPENGNDQEAFAH